MKVLVACEQSGVVRDAFIRHGHDAMSCDLEPSETEGPHYQGDIFDCLAEAEESGWTFDLMIAHPPCTHLSVSGARHFAAKRADGRQQVAIDFFMRLKNVPIAKKALENPVCIMSSVWRKPDQIIQPWQFGHGETKATCLWLSGLPLLVPTNVVTGRSDRIHKMPPGPNRARERSRTYWGIADAMATQWGTSDAAKEGQEPMSMDIAQAIQLIASNLHRSANHRSVTVQRDALATLFREYELLCSVAKMPHVEPDAAKEEST